MATKNARKSTRKSSTKSYAKPSKEALGLNRKLENGNTLVHCFGTDKAAAALVTVISDKNNRFWLNIRAKGQKPFSRPVDELLRPKGMSIARLAYLASRTGHVYVKR